MSHKFAEFLPFLKLLLFILWDCEREASSKVIQVSLNVWSFFRTSPKKQTTLHHLQADILFDGSYEIQ
jgi:hypothetical protein